MARRNDELAEKQWPIQSWEDDIPLAKGYKGVGIIDDETAGTIMDFGQGHLVDPDKTYSRAEYAFRAAKKVLGNSYILLIKISLPKGRIGWNALLLHQDVETTFGRITAT